MKLKKTFICVALAFVMLVPVLFAGCSLADLFGGKEENKDVELTNGAYKVTTYSVDGASDEEIVGSMAKVDNGTFTDWNGNVATIKIEGDKITITWDSMALTGTVTKTSISINSKVDDSQYVASLKYVEDVMPENGQYEVTTYAIDGISDTSVVGQTVIVNNGTFTDWGGHVTIYTILGDQIKIAFGTSFLTGTVAKTSITINEVVNGHSYFMVFTKK